jgi:D-threo-aldose 1-dehydrogenase
VRLRSLTLAGTEIGTTALGLGCATLFHLPRGQDRRALLETAFDAGIRHFDLAPIYGLGLSESEIAPFIRGRRETITLTTKFGIDPSLVGRLAGRLQRPVRSALGRLPKLSGGIKSAGRGPTSGWVGQLLYTSRGYSAQSAQASLHRSLKALGTDYVDILMLHDPTGENVDSVLELSAFLDLQVRTGTIRAWGVASDVIEPTEPVVALAKRSLVLQFRDDLFAPAPGATNGPTQGVITFGIMERALPLLTHYFEQSEEASRRWSDRLGIDVRDRISLPNLLVRHALRRNTWGPVLVSSTRMDRVRSAATQAGGVEDSSFARNESHAVSSLAEEMRLAYPTLRVAE